MKDDSGTKVTIATFAEKRRAGQPIAMLTAYDYVTARLIDESGIDGILVGDSLAMVMLGLPNTLGVTLEQMIHHIQAVRRGVKRALLIGDLPFMSYQASLPQAVRSAGRFVQEGGVEAVKLEGGRSYCAAVRAIVRAGIPVQGHIGLTPQSLNLFGGWKVQARTAESAVRLVDDALALEEAGCFSIVVESVPDRVAERITEKLTVPTIGIGASSATSGQILVIHDLLGLYDDIRPRFVKRYAQLATDIREAVRAYRDEVRERAFPGREHTYAIEEDEWERFLAVVEGYQPTK